VHLDPVRVSAFCVALSAFHPPIGRGAAPVAKKTQRPAASPARPSVAHGFGTVPQLPVAATGRRARRPFSLPGRRGRRENSPVPRGDGVHTCTLCGETKRSGFVSRAAGGWVCRACYRHRLAPRVRCSRCGRVGPAAARLGPHRSGPAVCERCYASSLHVARCSGCRETKSIHTRIQRRVLCVDCYGRLVRMRERCTSCGALRRVYVRDDGGAPLCRPCHHRQRRPTERCAACGTLAHPVARAAQGPLCSTCYHRTRTAPCRFCKRRKRVAARLANGTPVCPTCAFRRLTPRRTCAACRESKPTRRRTETGKPLCDACYGRRLRAA